jgi:dCMP deaminase
LPNQTELDEVYMGAALLHGRLSKAKRAKVGSVLITNTGVVVPGFNGTASGTCNDCEDVITPSLPYLQGDGPVLITKPEVIHAELNCILKCAKEGISTVGSVVYVTLSPCLPCAAMLKQAGIKKVIYRELYRDDSGVQYLVNNGVEVYHMKTFERIL